MSASIGIVSPGMTAALGRLRRGGLGVGLVALALTGIGAALSPSQFLRSWLLAFVFWTGTAAGCLCLAMMHHLSGGRWGLGIRRILEAGAGTLAFVALPFAPLALGARHVWAWADPVRLAADESLHEAVARKDLYLNVPFFLARAAFYFIVWAALAWGMSRLSLAQDRGGGERLARRLRKLSAAGLLLMGLTITFSAVDWGMSLEPRWFSTIYGALFLVGQGLSALALVIAIVALLGREQPLARIISPRTLHDLGKLLFAFVMLWAYISLSQFLIIWSGNLPEEIPFYIHRLHGGWQAVALVVVALHFVLPFMLLLSSDLKRNARALGTVAAGVFVLRFVDLYWLLGPDLHDGGGFHPHWLDLVAPIALGGLWLALLASRLSRRPLLPSGDPELIEILASEEAPGHP
jgi:hypothetical protein